MMHIVSAKTNLCSCYWGGRLTPVVFLDDQLHCERGPPEAARISGEDTLLLLNPVSVYDTNKNSLAFFHDRGRAYELDFTPPGTSPRARWCRIVCDCRQPNCFR